VPKRKSRRSATRELAALKKESDAALRDQIRRLLRQPIAKRTRFLRVRIPGGSTL
jgi:hypothetical protein